MKRVASIILLCAALLVTTAFAHSGRTDGDGGHYNRSTGEYHYHHGYPAHQHIDGICPYEFDDKTNHGSSYSKPNKQKREKKEESGYVAAVKKIGVWSVVGGCGLYFLYLLIWVPARLLKEHNQSNGKGKVNYMDDKRVRFVMFIVSATLAVVAGISSHIALDFPIFASAFVAVLICIPSTWQLFFMPVDMRAKHYFFSAGLYLAFWGGPIMLYALTFSKAEFVRTLGFIYLAALLVTWGLGAFLKEK